MAQLLALQAQDKELEYVVREYVLGGLSGYQIYKCAPISTAQESPAALPGLVVALTRGVCGRLGFPRVSTVLDNVLYVRELI